MYNSGMTATKSPDFVFLGGLREDYCITPEGTAIEHTLGGNAVYAAAGAAVWGVAVGLLGRVGSNFPQAWLLGIERAGISTHGVRRLAQPLDTRTFYAYLSPAERVDSHPALHYQRIGRPMPKALLDYQSSTLGQDSRQEFANHAVRPEDVPAEYLSAAGLHLAPADYLSHTTVPYRFKEATGDAPTLVSLDPSERYMTPAFRDDLPRLLHGVDVFLPSEMEARAFVPHGSLSPLELTEFFALMGPRIVVLKLGPAGQLLLDRETDERWLIPAYPGRVRDVTGAGDSYCGGFLVGLARTGSAIEAALHGSISASLTVEGSGALYALEAAPGLPQARLDVLRTRQRLAAIPAPTFEEAGRAREMEVLLGAIPGWRIERDPAGNVLARLPGGSGPPLIVSAHLDSVFPAAFPLEIRQEQDRIHGPGIGDNALGLGCLVELAHDLRPGELPGDLWLAANVAEEGLGNLAGMKALVERFKDSPSAYLVIESTALGHIYHRALPVHRYRITLRGPGGHAWVHSGRPSAVHALLQLGTLLTRIRLPGKPPTTMNIGTVQGGSSINTLAAEAQLELEIRSESAEVLARVDRAVQRICAPDNLIPPLEIELELIGERPSGAIPADHPLVALAARVSAARSGTKPKLGIASTDASQPLSQGYPAICTGITRGGGAHSASEYIETTPIAAGYEALCEIIRSWMELQGGG